MTLIQRYNNMSLDYERWQKAKDKIIGEERARQQIGTLSEKTIHAVVKNYYEPDEDRQEIPIEGKCADIYIAPQGGIDSISLDGTRGNIIEIQTRQWEKLKPKLEVFLKDYDVTVVLPIPDHKQIIWIDPDTGELSKPGVNRRYSNDYTGFPEIYRIRQFLTNPHLHIRLLYMDMIEYKLLSGRSADRKKYGAVRYDRMPTNLTKEYVLERPEDYMMFVPEGLDKEFGSADFAKKAGINTRLTGYVVGLLFQLGILERVGKGKRGAYIYRVKEQY